MVANTLPKGRIVITGGTGFLGLNLARALHGAGCEVVLISRTPPTDEGPWIHATWDARTLGNWASHLDGAAAIVNLVGRTVDCVKTPNHCDEILRSRVESTKVIGQAVGQAKTPPPVWVQMSTAHIYGDPLKAVCDEDAALGYGLAPFVGQAWEASYAQSVLAGMRQVILRTSFVLGQTGGALPRLVSLARWGLGGKVGHGKQGISWIHQEDMNQLFLRAITNESMEGIYLATAPNPTSNADFMCELRRVLGVPVGLPAMSWMVRFGAPLLMNTDPELAIYGRYCVSRRLQEEGFQFKFPDVQSALQDLFGAQAKSVQRTRLATTPCESPSSADSLTGAYS